MIESVIVGLVCLFLECSVGDLIPSNAQSACIGARTWLFSCLLRQKHKVFFVIEASTQPDAVCANVVNGSRQVENTGT